MSFLLVYPYYSNIAMHFQAHFEMFNEIRTIIVVTSPHSVSTTIKDIVAVATDGGNCLAAGAHGDIGILFKGLT